MTAFNLRPATVFLVLLSGCCCFGGCGGVTVDGYVAYKGEPIERGSIDLVPTNQTAGTAARAAVERGVFALPGELKPGEYVVQFRWPKKTGKKIKVDADAPGAVNGEVDETIDVIPTGYNEKSTLRRELAPGRNYLKFDLEPRD